MTIDTLPEKPRTRTKLGDYAGVLLSGFAMGSADVVPGVSGGTIAFILGIYEELIGSIRMVGQPVFWRALLRGEWRAAMRLVNALFLVVLGAGIVGAIFLLAPGIEWMLINQPVLIWSFFFGLVLASIVIVSTRIRRWSASRFIALFLGTAVAYWVVGLVPVQTPDTWWFLMLSGAIAICAMILPGISGSFIMVLLGKYHFFINAINERDFASLAFAAVGAAIGLVTFAQVLSWLFRRYHDITVATLAGFMIGSLREIWPWKETLESVVDPVGEIVPLVDRNILPALMVNGAFNAEIPLSAGAALLGIILVIGVERIAQMRTRAAESPADQPAVA